MKLNGRRGWLDAYERGGNAKSSAAELDIKSLHAKIGELVLENDYLERALGKVGLLSVSVGRSVADIGG